MSVTTAASILGIHTPGGYCAPIDFFSKSNHSRLGIRAATSTLLQNCQLQGSCSTPVSETGDLQEIIRVNNVLVPRDYENLDQHAQAWLKVFFFLMDRNVEIVATARTPDIDRTYEILFDLMVWDTMMNSLDRGGSYNLMLHDGKFPVLNHVNAEGRKFSLLVFPPNFKDTHNTTNLSRTQQVREIRYRDGVPVFSPNLDYFKHPDRLLRPPNNYWEWYFYFSRVQRSEAFCSRHKTDTLSFINHLPSYEEPNDGSKVAAITANQLVTGYYNQSLIDHLPGLGISRPYNNPHEIQASLLQAGSQLPGFEGIMNNPVLALLLSESLPMPLEQFLALKFPPHIITRHETIGDHYLASPVGINRQRAAMEALIQVRAIEESDGKNARKIRQMTDEIEKLNRFVQEYSS